MIDSSGVGQATHNRRAQENLDARIALFPPLYAFSGVCLVLCAVVAGFWGVFGSIPVKSNGSGIMVRSGQQVFAVQSESSGRVRRIAVRVGDEVEAGQVLAELDQSELEIRIATVRATVRDLETDFKELTERLAKEVARHEKNAREVQELTSQSITEFEQLRNELAGVLRDDLRLARSNLITRPAEIETRTAYQNVVAEIADLKIQRMQARQDLADLKNQAAQQTDDAEQQLCRVPDDWLVPRLSGILPAREVFESLLRDAAEVA